MPISKARLVTGHHCKQQDYGQNVPLHKHYYFICKGKDFLRTFSLFLRTSDSFLRTFIFYYDYMVRLHLFLLHDAFQRLRNHYFCHHNDLFTDDFFLTVSMRHQIKGLASHRLRLDMRLLSPFL